MFGTIIHSDNKVVKAIRTGLFTAAAILVQTWIAGAQTITSIDDVVGDGWDHAGGAGLLAALGTLGFFAARDRKKS